MTSHPGLAAGGWTALTREEFCRLFFDDEPAADAAPTLSKYFLQFALLARR